MRSVRKDFEQATTAVEQALANRNMTTASEHLALADSLKFSADETEQIDNLEIVKRSPVAILDGRGKWPQAT